MKLVAAEDIVEGNTTVYLCEVSRRVAVCRPDLRFITRFPGQSLAFERAGETFCRDILKSVALYKRNLQFIFIYKTFLQQLSWYEKNDAVKTCTLSLFLNTCFVLV